MPTRSLEQRINQIVSEATKQVAELVRADLAAEVQRVIGGSAKGARHVQALPPGKKAAKPAARNLPAHCIFPGCTNAHKGPRFSFLCAEHIGISKVDKKKHLDDWKVARKGSAPKTPSSPNVAGKQAGRSHRRGSLDEATVTRVFKVIEDNPGLRGEEIYKKLPLAPELTKKVLAKLRDSKRVKTTGEKRAMKYAAA
jgi:hypothetical protein